MSIKRINKTVEKKFIRTIKLLLHSKKKFIRTIKLLFPSKKLLQFGAPTWHLNTKYQLGQITIFKPNFL